MVISFVFSFFIDFKPGGRCRPWSKMTISLTFERFIEPARAGTYFTFPFAMPAGSESLTLSYRYPRHAHSQTETGSGTFTAREEINIIDLGLIDPDGRQVGASGSDKSEISISETQATPGYQPPPSPPGEWRILVGAYNIAPAASR